MICPKNIRTKIRLPPLINGREGWGEVALIYLNQGECQALLSLAGAFKMA